MAKSIARCLAALLLAACAATQAQPRPAGVPVLMYHQFTDRHPPGASVMTLERFAEQMRYLAEQGYRTLSIDELVAIMRREAPLPPKPVVLTFDDGWRSWLPAVPILQRYRFKASFWIITGVTRQEGDYLEWPELQALARHPDFEFQSHTVTHPWGPISNLLTWMEGRPAGRSPADVLYELVESKRTLEARLGRRVDYLAWPQGLHNDAVVELARKAGYKATLTVENGPALVGGDVFRINRMLVHGACDLQTFAAQLAAMETREC